jgi:large subunit ribosomal protein L23
MKHENILIRPVVTEKSTLLRDKQNKYTFLVHKDSNKLLVLDALKKMFNVTPLEVRMMNVRGKLKKVRYKYGFTSSYKKAIITLKKGDKIPIFEGA